jgi:hypothetical protein
MGDGREVLEGVVTAVPDDHRVDIEIDAGDQQVGGVAARLGHHVRGDVAAGAGTVFDDHRSTAGLLQAIGHGAGQAIDAAAG